MQLDKAFFGDTRATAVKPDTHQKSIFCVRLHMAAGAALYIFPARPGAAR